MGISYGNDLENLEFANRRSNQVTKWININEVKINEAKERCGMVKATQVTLGDIDSSHISDRSVGSVI
jgi:hypothetical protein